jgi:hypothetical protein
MHRDHSTSYIIGKWNNRGQLTIRRVLSAQLREPISPDMIARKIPVRGSRVKEPRQLIVETSDSFRIPEQVREQEHYVQMNANSERLFTFLDSRL